MSQPAVSEPVAIAPSIAAGADPRGLGGLIALVEGQPQAFPLAETKIRAHIIGGACRTVVEQRFENPLSASMEATHIFPLPPAGAVVEMSLRCGDLVVEADCKALEEAQATFDEARAAGHRAALLTQSRDDVHTLQVTRIPAGEAVSVRLVVVEQLEVVDGLYRWRFPTTIAPRYLPGVPVSHEGPGVLPDTDAVPDASRLQPPLRLEGGARLDLEVTVAGRPRRVASSLHCVAMDIEDDGVRVAPSTKATLNKDFILSFAAAAEVGPGQHAGARAWTDGAYTVVEVQPTAALDVEGLPRDAVFVVDISGSMGGGKIEAAKAALSAALHGLVLGDRFKLIAFDHELMHFNEGFTEYSEQTLQAADAWIGQLYARGGTEMLPAIEAALDGATPLGRLRTVLFITDGQSWDEARLVSAVIRRQPRTLFFTLGIDTAVNGALLQRLARVGGGTCELATPNDDIDALITRFEARFGSPLAADVRVAGRPDASRGGVNLFAGRPALLFIEGAPGEITLTAEEGARGFPMSLVPSKAPEGFPIGALWARRRVAALEDRLELDPFEDAALRAEIVKVALPHHIASRFTAFVAVERSRKVEGAMTEVVQPAELPEGWDPGFKGGGGGGFGAAPTGPARSGGQARQRKRSAAAPMPPARPAPAPMPAPLSASMSEPAPAAKPAPAPMKEEAKSRGGGLLGRLIGGLPKRAQKVSGAPMSGVPMSEASMSPSDSKIAPPPPAPEALYDYDAEDAFDDGVAMADMEEEAFAEISEGGLDHGAVEQALVKQQGADGSYGGDVAATAAALVALVLLGHTRQSGLRRRTVLKAAKWLQGQGGDLAAEALALLEAAEAGGQIAAAQIASTPWVTALTGAGETGETLRQLLAELG